MPLGEWRSIGYNNALSFILIFLIPTFGLLFQVERSWKLEKKVRGLSIVVTLEYESVYSTALYIQ